MLKRLSLSNIGPASKMEMDLAPRLNLITGDNGLGKSFLLDVAWWSLTRHWPHEVNRNMTSAKIRSNAVHWYIKKTFELKVSK